MKKTFQIAILSCLMAVSLQSYAKGQSGVYMTLADYTNKKLSYEIDSRVHPNNAVINMPYITVKDNGKKLKLNKSEIYGYVDNNNKAYRFYKNEAYQIAEAGGITIYMQGERNSQTKELKVIRHYYFSATPGSDIMPLTVNNLKNAYRSNDKFIDLLDQYFNKNDINAYDNIHNTYEVNYVYAKSMK